MWDIELNNIKYRLVRGADGTVGYRRRWSRARGGAPPGGSNPVRPTLVQTSWARGSAWWKPSLSQEPDSYYLASHMNLWRQPGKIEPWGDPVETDITAWRNNGVQAGLASLGGSDMFTMAQTSVNDSPNLDVYKWTATTGAWTNTGYSIGVAGASKDFIYDPLLGKILSRAGNAIYQFDNTANGTSLITLTNSCLNSYARMFLHNGRLFVYTGKVLVEIEDRDTTPVETVITDDGFGNDWIQNGASTALVGQLDLAVPTAEGIYYVKNVEQAGTVVAYVFRVERDSLGNWNSVPITTLPNGNVALSIGYHLGSVVISAAADAFYLLDSAEAATGSFPVTFYQVTGGNLGTLGVPLGQDVADETPYQILLADGPHLYIGGQKRVWVYDAVRGGLHPFFEFDTPSTTHPCRTMVKVNDKTGASNQPYYLFILGDVGGSDVNEYYVPARPGVGLATVTNFGDDLTTYTLESNYFDFDLPMEYKSLTAITVVTDQNATVNTGNWNVYVSVDDGTWTDVATFNDFSDGHQRWNLLASSSSLSGKRFRYKLVYQTKSATFVVPIRAIGFEAATGVAVQDWQLRIDGTEAQNVEGEVLDPQDIYDNLAALMQNSYWPVPFVDMYQNADQDASSEFRVMPELVDIQKDQPGEGYVDVVLVPFYVDGGTFYA